MPCSLCGDICRCSLPEDSSISPRWLPEVSVSPDAAPPQASQEVEPSCEATAPLCAEPFCDESTCVEPALSNSNDSLAPEDSTAWRQEVAARLNRYQSRRKPRPPRYPSLRLRFEAEEPIGMPNPAPMTDSGSSRIMPMVSNQALAFDRFTEETTALEQPLRAVSENVPAEEMASKVAPVTAPITGNATGQPTAKIIEFPRSWTPPVAPPDELAEPVITRPRILEAPEIAPPPPALGGITIEATQQPEMEKRVGIDIPLQSAPVGRRMLAALIDGTIIASACTVFSFIFWKLTALRPPRLQIVGILAGLAVLLWAAYQYLLVVYAGSTPGLRLARLELARFDGRPAGRGLRRWRVLASYLSAVSLGMGYSWVFLDEDSLCWHDRITHTYLAPVHSEKKGLEAASGGNLAD
jgi:uncharacterized RDD family membrane protein YckC